MKERDSGVKMVWSLSYQIELRRIRKHKDWLWSELGQGKREAANLEVDHEYMEHEHVAALFP